ncbi:MAG: NYN domain-containing protein [Ignavibacteriae bacterium]|nr:NYN domain-containing protein [Ignavibacteriota bacterium]
MHQAVSNYAFIDSQNLNLAIRELGWSLDWHRFRVYLEEKYSVTKAYLFLGFLEQHRDLYKSLQEKGYILIFKPTLTYKDGKTKGNCDAELVLQAMIDFESYDKAIIVTGDGDFHCLIDYLMKQGKLAKLLIPNQRSYSALLKRFRSEYLGFISDLQAKLEYTKKKRTP